MPIAGFDEDGFPVAADTGQASTMALHVWMRDACRHDRLAEVRVRIGNIVAVEDFRRFVHQQSDPGLDQLAAVLPRLNGGHLEPALADRLLPEVTRAEARVAATARPVLVDTPTGQPVFGHLDDERGLSGDKASLTVAPSGQREVYFTGYQLPSPAAGVRYFFDAGSFLVTTLSGDVLFRSSRFHQDEASRPPSPANNPPG